MFFKIIPILMIIIYPVLGAAVSCPVNPVAVHFNNITVDQENSPVDFADESFVIEEDFPFLKNTMMGKEAFAEYLAHIESYAKTKAYELNNAKVFLRRSSREGACHFRGYVDGGGEDVQMRIVNIKQGVYRPFAGYPSPGEQSLRMELRISFSVKHIDFPAELLATSYDAKIVKHKIQKMHLYFFVWLKQPTEAPTFVPTAYDDISTQVKFGVNQGSPVKEYLFTLPIGSGRKDDVNLAQLNTNP